MGRAPGSWWLGGLRNPIAAHRQDGHASAGCLLANGIQPRSPPRGHPLPRPLHAGSKELGIPTANLDDGSLRDSMAEAVTGIYAGWASVGDSPIVYKMCMSVGG